MVGGRGSARPEAEPLWSRSGNQLDYRAAEGIVTVTVSTAPTCAMRARRTAFAGESESDLTHQNYNVAPDSKLLAVQSAGGEAQVVLVYNWGRELREKLGARKR